MSVFKAGDEVVVNNHWGRFTGVVESVCDSIVLVSYIVVSGDVRSTWFNINHVSLYDRPEFGIIGEHHV